MLTNRGDALARTLRSLGVLTVIILLVSLGISSLWPWTAQRQMSAYTDHWNDISHLRKDVAKEGYRVENIQSSPKVLNDKGDWSKHILFIAGVEKPYTKEEITAIKKFLEHGGRLVLADDGGYSEPLLKSLVGKVELNHSRLYSPLYAKNPDFVLAEGYIDSGPIIDTDFKVMTNRPAVFQGTIPGTVFCNSDPTSWLDSNGNKDRDLDEEQMSYVIGFFVTGNAFLSDPSIFINDMWVREQNSAFGMSMIEAMLPTGGTVIFDESRHLSSDPAQQAQRTLYDAFMFIAYDNYARGVLVAVCIIGVLTYMRFVRLPTDWHHMPNLDVPWYLNYEEGTLGSSDALRVRMLLENRIRVALRLSGGEYKVRRKAILENVLKDPDLLKFIRSWDIYKKEDLERVLDKMKDLEIEGAFSSAGSDNKTSGGGT